MQVCVGILKILGFLLLLYHTHFPPDNTAHLCKLPIILQIIVISTAKRAMQYRTPHAEFGYTAYPGTIQAEL